MKARKRIFIFILISLLLIGAKGLFAIGDFMKKEPSENLPGQNLPVIAVPGKIVFQSNRDGALSEVWLLEDGKLRKIATGLKVEEDIPEQMPNPYRGMLSGAFADLKQPKWSPDGTKILCVGEGKLAIFNSEGQRLEEIVPKKYPHLAQWSPDGENIYFRAQDKLSIGGGSDNIYRLNLENRSESRITNLSPLPGVRSILSFAVSPDDKMIVFQMDGEQEYGISNWTIRTDGSDLKLLVKYAQDPVFSPDGTKIAYSANYLSSGEKLSEHNELFILDLKSGQTTQVTHNNWEDRFPTFSPDGTKIAFQSTRHFHIAKGSEIFVINTDGTGEARLTPPQRNKEYPGDSFQGWATDEYPDWTN